jgi:2'-5' RNA ligase
VPAESLHVTLCFLGTRPVDEAAAIGAAVVGCAAPVPGLGLRAAAWLPRRRPGVLAIDLDDAQGACAALQRSLARSLAALGAYEPGRRRFRPHVTVARVRRGARVEDPAVPVLPALPAFAGAAVTLFRSELAPGGARYEALARAVLAA